MSTWQKQLRLRYNCSYWSVSWHSFYHQLHVYWYISFEYSGRIPTFKGWATLQPSLIKVVGEEKEFLKIQSFVVVQFAFDNLVTVSTHLSNNSNAINLGALPCLTFYLVALVPGLEKWVREPDFLRRCDPLQWIVDNALVWGVFVAYVRTVCKHILG